MPLFKIERSIAGLSDDDLSAGGYRAVSCSHKYPGLTWLRSFVDPEAKTSTCFYLAPSREVLAAHQADAELPWTAIGEVIEFDASAFYGAEAAS